MTQHQNTTDTTDATFDDKYPATDYSHEPTRIIVTPHATSAPQPKDGDDTLLDLSDDATLDKLSAGGFLRLRPEGQNVISVSLFNTAMVAKTHYSQEQKKSFRCLQPASNFCCEKLGEARDAIGILAIQYAGASTKDGTQKKGADPDLRAGYVSLSKSALITMRKALPEGASLYGVDWKIWKKSNGIGYEYAVQRTTPAYKTLGLEKQAEELVAPYRDGVKLRKRVAKPMSVVEVKLLLTGEAPELDEGSQLEDMDRL